SLVGLTESLRWIRTIESPAGGKPVKSTVPLLKLEASVRDIHVKWADASLFPETEDRKSPWVLRLKKLAGSKAVKIELAFHISENLDRLRDNLKASLFSALVQRENGDWSIPLQFVRKDATHTVFVGFHGENVRRIDSLDDKDGSVSV